MLITAVGQVPWKCSWLMKEINALVVFFLNRDGKTPASLQVCSQMLFQQLLNHTIRPQVMSAPFFPPKASLFKTTRGPRKQIYHRALHTVLTMVTYVRLRGTLYLKVLLQPLNIDLDITLHFLLSKTQVVGLCRIFRC